MVEPKTAPDDVTSRLPSILLDHLVELRQGAAGILHTIDEQGCQPGISLQPRRIEFDGLLQRHDCRGIFSHRHLAAGQQEPQIGVARRFRKQDFDVVPRIGKTPDRQGHVHQTPSHVVPVWILTQHALGIPEGLTEAAQVGLQQSQIRQRPQVALGCQSNVAFEKVNGLVVILFFPGEVGFTQQCRGITPDLKLMYPIGECCDASHTQHQKAQQPNIDRSHSVGPSISNGQSGRQLRA